MTKQSLSLSLRLLRRSPFPPLCGGGALGDAARNDVD